MHPMVSIDAGRMKNTEVNVEEDARKTIHGTEAQNKINLMR